jgi:Excalibur calcium-binding domain/Staphylococcal nuclease homologue
VTDVIDGDTVDVSTGERIRIIGIDTPERGQCGFAEATSHLESLVSGKTVALVPGARADKDRYGRLLRYVDTSDGIDVGLALVEADLAVSRYDSRDGYGGHAREASYTAADDGDGVNAHCATAAARVPAPAPAAVPTTVPAVATGDVHYRNCDAARAVGAAPLHRGDPGYRSGLDRDGDGTACE